MIDADDGPAIALAPSDDEGVRRAVVAGGGRVVSVERADGLIWLHPFDIDALSETLARSPARWIQLPFAGIERFLEAGVLDPARAWTCTKGVYAEATAEHALALALAGARRLHVHARDRRWVAPGIGSPERTLAGASVVVVGTGGIGGALARMLLALNAIPVGVNRSGRPLEGAVRTVARDAMREVVADAAFVVLAAPLTPGTRHMIDAGMMASMRRDTWLVNVARGGLVDHDALVDALKERRIGGCALDVTEPEPLPEDHPLWSLENALITPHVANTWDMALPALRELVRRNVARFAAGEELEATVDLELGY